MGTRVRALGIVAILPDLCKYVRYGGTATASRRERATAARRAAACDHGLVRAHGNRGRAGDKTRPAFRQSFPLSRLRIRVTEGRPASGLCEYARTFERRSSA